MFSSKTSLSTILTQKEELENERLISFMSGNLQGRKLNYPIVEKQSYTI